METARQSDLASSHSPQTLGLAVQRFFADLPAHKKSNGQGLSANRKHQAYSLRTPKTLPRVPTEDELQAVLRACSTGSTGRRNRAIVLVMADAGLRAGEVVRLLIEQWTPAQRSSRSPVRRVGDSARL